MRGTKLAQIVTIVALVSLLGNSGLLFGDDTLSGGPYAQNPNNPTATSPPDPTKMNIVWYTAQGVPATINCKVQYRGINDIDCPVGSGNQWCIAQCSDQIPTLTRPGNCTTGSSPCLQTRYELRLGVPGNVTNPPLTAGKIYFYTLWGNGATGPVQLEPCTASPCNPTNCPTASCTMPSFETLSTTASLPPPPYKYEFFVFGDSGDSSSGSVQAQMAATILATCPGVDFGLHVGDIIYPGGCGAMGQLPCRGTQCGGPTPLTWQSGECTGYPTMYLQPYHDIVRDVPNWTALGNHDSDFFCPGGLCCTGSPYCSNPLCGGVCNGATPPDYVNIFSLPSNGPTGQPVGRNYWFDFGTARFIVLDSNAYRTTLQNDIKNWLNATLTTNPKLWNFVIFHHSPYSSGCHGLDPQWCCLPGPPPSCIPNFCPPCSSCTGPNDCSQPNTNCQCTVTWLQATGSIVDTMKGKVDIVFTGHDHDFEFVPASAVGTATKPFYIVTGGGGAGLDDARAACQNQTNRSCFTNGVFYGTYFNCNPAGGTFFACPANYQTICSPIAGTTLWRCPGKESFTVIDVIKNVTPPVDQVRVRQIPYDSTIPIFDQTFTRVPSP